MKKVLFFIYVISILYLGSKLYNLFRIILKNIKKTLSSNKIVKLSYKFFIDFLSCNGSKDHFMSVDMDDSIASIDDSYGKIVTTYKNPHVHKNCCMVKKIFNKEKNKFEYKYEKLDTCHHNMIPAINHNHANLFIDGVNGWDNEKCRLPDESKDKDYLGSCRRINFECKDFVTQSQCKKYNMEWSDKTCTDPYRKPFKIKEREINLN